jgi:hypothetical protein
MLVTDSGFLAVEQALESIAKQSKPKTNLVFIVHFSWLFSNRCRGLSRKLSISCKQGGAVAPCSFELGWLMPPESMNLQMWSLDFGGAVGQSMGAIDLEVRSRPFRMLAL